MDLILSLSYGKDSLACLGAIEKLGWGLDRIVHAEIWATHTIPADLPPMIEFKEKADRIIQERYGITVEHIKSDFTYEDVFYQTVSSDKSKNKGRIYGFPMIKGAWCNSRLKVSVLNRIDKGCISYVGIASDEPKRFKVLDDLKVSPLISAGWTEKNCLEWCKANDLISPIYETSMRGGCWFCHNQSVKQLRILRHNYPEYWGLLLKWDKVSPVTFKPKHTVHDYDIRFQMEDKGIIIPDDRCFRWKSILDNTEDK